MLKEEIGDRASEIIWRGRQWIVTNFGLETLGDPFPYEVAATRLTEGWQGADESLLAWAQPQSLSVIVLPGVGHFFHGQLGWLKRVVTQQLQPSAGAPLPPSSS